MKRFISLMAVALMSVAMLAGKKGEVKECKLYKTNFQDWEAVASSTTPSTKTVTTKYSLESLTFTFAETQIAPEGTNAKFTNDIITVGYAMAAKTATPYIETSVLTSITKVHYVHAATGGERGWGLQYKSESDADWVTVSSAVCQQAGTAVDADINKENVRLRWYNLNKDQNAYMTELIIYGMAEDDGQPEEYTISYFDQEGNRLGDAVQTELETLVFAYGESDLTIPAGYKFRGWYDNDKKRHSEGEDLTGDLRLNALVTKIEDPVVGDFYTYDLRSNVFYPDDHEALVLTSGYWHDGTHGWAFKKDQSFGVKVAGNAVVVLTICQYGGDNATWAVKDAENNDLGSVAAKADADGKDVTFNYHGESTTLTFTLNSGGENYLHKIVVYNVVEIPEKDATTGYYMVPANDVASLLLILAQANSTGNAKIFLPDGIYDLGEKVLTSISGNNISIIGQSMKGTIIKNAPDYRTESINNTATLYLTGDNIYLQDLTIQNALDYFKSNNGRAVALWAKNTKTICKNVRLLSYQDTYYSNKIGGVHYMEDCEIHGTVDFICGEGSVYFKNNLIFAEKRPKDTDILTASSADTNDKGYVFEGCTLQCANPTVSLGRAWNNKAKTVFLNTIFDYSAGEFQLPGMRWTAEGIGVLPELCGEYNTKDVNGNVISPAENNATFTCKGTQKQMNTILTQEQAATFTMAYTLGDWATTAAADAKQVLLEYKEDGTWLDTDATIFLVEKDGNVSIVTERPAVEEGTIVRAANARGGFGKPAVKEGTAANLDNKVSNSKVTKIFRNGQLVIVRDNKQYNVLGAKL